MNDMKRVLQCVGIVSVLVLVGFAGPAVAVDNIAPDDDGSQFAWGENIGWANAEPGIDGGPGVFVEDDALSGYIWAENVGWINLSCLTNTSCGTVDYRVMNDGSGNLDGFGWGENIGWVNFNPATGGGVEIDDTTGEFSGDAWSENVGWIRFRGQGTVQYGVTTSWRGTPASNPADLDGNSVVNMADLMIVVSCFGQSAPLVPPCDAADLAPPPSGDGVINILDISFVGSNFTP